MGVLVRLASQVGRRDASPNLELAIELSNTKDAQGVAQVANALTSGPKAEGAPENQLPAYAEKVVDALGAKTPENIAARHKRLQRALSALLSATLED